MYQAANTDKERFECLSRIIKINPNNTKAKQLLDQLLAPPTNPIQPTSSHPEKKSNKAIAYFIAIIGSLCLICLVIILATQIIAPTQTLQTIATNVPTIIPQQIIPVFPAPVNSSSAVQYQISGSAYSATVTYENATSDTEQQDISIPWTYPTFRASSGQILYISAQISSSNPATITCTILLNGRVYKTSTSNGQYVIVDCSGEVP